MPVLLLSMFSNSSFFRTKAWTDARTPQGPPYKTNRQRSFKVKAECHNSVDYMKNQCQLENLFLHKSISQVVCFGESETLTPPFDTETT